MQNKREIKRLKKIVSRLVILAVVIFAALLGEFIYHRYSSNRSMYFRTEGETVQIYRDKNWLDFPIHGVSISAEKPGLHGETDITKEEYKRRFRDLRAGDVNVIRVCSVLSPAFYKAFFEYNLLTDKPLYMLHGISLRDNKNNSGNDAYDEKFNADFLGEIRRTVDVIHGKVSSKQSNGHNSGVYNLNVSPYVIGYTFCEEMGNDFAVNTNRKNPHVMGFEGEYLYTVNASPYESWLAAMGNYTISYEQEKYGGSIKLVSLSNLSSFQNIRITEKFDAGILAFNHLQEKFIEF